MVLSGVLAVGMVLVLVGGNIRTFASWSGKLQRKSASDSKTVFYGELFDMMRYIRESTSDKEIGITGDRAYVSRFFKPLDYVARKEGVDLVNMQRNKSVQDIPTFFSLYKSAKKSELASGTYKGQPIESYKFFGQVMILKMRREDSDQKSLPR